MILFIAVMSVLIIQRLMELRISSRNFTIMMREGGIEYGREHYKYIVMLHSLFIVSMAVEYVVRDHYGKLSDISYLFLVIFALLQLMRFWVISSLGKYWNTRIVRVPGSKLIRSGPYKFLKHPNYVVVALEIFCLPMIFGLVYTAIIFTILNSLMLFVRIKEENKVLTN
jgi:methyltransferase